MTGDLPVKAPLVYVITDGNATAANFSEAARKILDLVAAAAAEEVPLVQIREKLLSGRDLFNLTAACALALRGSGTKLLVNDRADIAAAAGADGVHLTESSIPVSVIRRSFGEGLIIAASVHSSDRAAAAAGEGADLVVYGPVFDTPGKGAAVGLEALSETCRNAGALPVVGLGGIDASNCRSVIRAGAAGVAGIRSFGDRDSLRKIVRSVRET